MKSKTKVLFLTLSVVLVALSIFTAKLYLSQDELKKALSENCSMTENQMLGNEASTNGNQMIRTSYMPGDDGDNFVFDIFVCVITFT